MWDSMFLMLLALVVFGPRRLPQIGRQIGKLMYEFRKASNDFKFQMEEELRVSEDAERRKKEEEERARTLALSPPSPTQTIEAQAGIGALEAPAVRPTSPPAVGLASPYSGEVNAVEQASVSAPPPAVGQSSSYSGESSAVGPTSPELVEGTYPPVTAEATSTEPGPRIYPRINPPSVGETVAASRYGANGRAGEPAAETAPMQDAATESVAAEANIGAEPGSSAGESPTAASPAAGSSSDPTRTETVSQHG
jgi:sec-independent protein translocase protein TatB